MASEDRVQDELAHALFVRYAVQRAIERATTLAVELLGGMAYVSSSEISYLYAAARCLAFHPPSRQSAASAVGKYLAGDSFVVE